MPWPRSVPGHLCVCLYFSFGNSSHCEIRETLGSKSWVLSSFVVVHLSLKKRGTLVCHLRMLLKYWVLCRCVILQVISMSCQSPVSFLCATGFWSLVLENSFPLPIDEKIFAASPPSSSVILFICCVTDLVLIWTYGQTECFFSFTGPIHRPPHLFLPSSWTISYCSHSWTYPELLRALVGFLTSGCPTSQFLLWV